MARVAVPILMKKVGCSSVYDELGELCLVTVMSLCENHLVKIVEREDGGKIARLARSASSKYINRPQSVELSKFRLEGALKLCDFWVKAGDNVDSGLSEGTKLDLSAFAPGVFVDVTGTSLGKGFAGAMKRHGFRGLRASHGVSITHRSHGSTGQCQDAGKLFKGKKMAGHMGNKRVTVKGLKVVHVDAEDGLIAVHGSIPGPSGARVLVKKVGRVYANRAS